MTRSFSFSTYLVGMALVIALPLMGLLAYNIRDDFRRNQEYAESTSLQFARLTAEQAGNALRQGENMLIGLAQIPEVRALDPHKCSALLRELNDLLRQYPNVVTRDATGALVCSALTLPGGARPRAVSDYYLEEVLRTRGFVVGKPVRGNFTGKWVLALAYPLRDGQNSIAGVVVLPMDLGDFHPAAGAVSLPDGMVIQIINADGVVIASTKDPGTWVGRNIGNTELVTKGVTARPGVMRVPDAEGIPRIYGIAAVRGTDWRVYAGVPTEAVFEKGWRELRRLVMIIALTIAMAALLAFLLARRALGPIRNVVAAAAAVAAGDKAARALPAGPTEVRAVATRFNAMLDALDVAEQRMSGIIRSAMDGVITVNERHEIILVNPAAERLFGYGAADLLGKPLNILIPDNYQPAHDEHIRNFRSTNVAHRMMGRFGQIIGRRADGREFAIDASISQMEQAGQRQFTVIMRDITRRIEAENALRESEERLRLAVTSGGVGLWEWDIATDKLIWNGQIKAMFGLPQDSAELTLEAFLSAVHSEDRDETRQLYTAALENHTGFDHAFRIVHPGGDVRWIVSRGYGLYDPDGRPLGMIGATLDITERKRAEMALSDSERNYRTLADSAPALIWASGPDKLCNYFNQPWLKFTGRTLEQELGDGWAEGVHPDDVAHCMAAYVDAFDRRVPFSMEYRLRRHDGEYRWVRDDGCPRDDSHGNFIGYLGYVMDITEGRRAADAIAASERRYRQTLDGMMEGCMLIGFDWTYLYVNETAARHGHQERENLIGRKIWEVYPGVERSEIFAKYRCAMERREPQRFDGSFTFPDRSVGWYELSAQPAPEGIFVLSLDITERKRTELALRENYEILDRIFATTHFCIVYLDRHFNFIRVNKAYADACGYPPGFFTGKNHFELYPGEEIEAIFQQVVATGQPFTTHAHPFRFPDHPEWGTTYWDWTLHPIKSADDAVEGLLFALLDVTERTRAAEAERGNELRLRLAAKAGNIGFWDRDIASGRVYLSAEWKSQIGYRDDEIPTDDEEWASRLHPEDRERVFSQFNAHVENGGSDVQTEYRMRHKDGSYRWFHVQGELLSDAAGAPRRVVGCRIDITAFKLVQQELESRIALAQLLESLARAAGEAKGPAEAMQICLARLCEFGKWTLGRVAIFRSGDNLHLPESATWYPADPAGFDEFIRASNNLDHFKPRGRFISVVLRERKPIWLPDLSADCEYGRRSVALAHGLRAAFAFPLVIQDEVAGFFEFYATTPRPPDPLLMEASELIASQLAVVVEHSRARETQIRLAGIVESSNDAIVSRSRDGIVESWNAAAERMFGWAAREIIGQPMSLVVPPERVGELQPLVKRAMRGEHVHPVETTYMHKDGRRIDTHITLSGIMNERGEGTTLAMTIRDITEIKRKEQALHAYSMRLRGLSARLLEVEEAERCSIARELHDRIGQDLSALSLIFEMLRGQSAEESRAAVNARLRDMQDLLRAIVANVRDVMAELRPPALDDYGLVAALRHHLARFAARTTIAVDIKGIEPSPRLPSVVETAMFRISQEALSNIAKHAQAQKVEFSLNEDSRRVILEIADDGVGFDPKDTPKSKATWGITTMRERAEAVGIGFRVESAPGSGTRVVLEVARSAA